WLASFCSLHALPRLAPLAGHDVRALRVGIPPGDIGRLDVELPLGDAVAHLLRGPLHIRGRAQAIKRGDAVVRARGPHGAVAIKSVVPPSNTVPLVIRDPVKGLAVAAPPAAEPPLSSTAVVVVVAPLVAALHALRVVQNCCHMLSS